MRRDAMQQLYDWKEKTTRKPLIVRGARQVGEDMVDERICIISLQTVCLHQF